MSDLFDDDMKCVQCNWTLYTGGMTEDDHEALGHPPLVPANPKTTTNANNALCGPGGDMACSVCSWTVHTGGMTQDAHEKLGHGPLVPAGGERQSKLPNGLALRYGSGSGSGSGGGDESSKKCKKCGVDVAPFSSQPPPCRFHPGEKTNYKRNMHPAGEDLSWTWSCCGAKYEHVGKSSDRPPPHARDGCVTKEKHEF